MWRSESRYFARSWRGSQGVDRWLEGRAETWAGESDLSDDKGLDLTVMQMPEICLFVR
jgi:hypothetical protein